MLNLKLLELSLNGAKKRHSFSSIHLYTDDIFPSLDNFDLLIIMGGLMNIYEYEKYPWLRDEKKFIEETISVGKSVFELCLGAQLVTDVLKAEIFKNNYTEIGWFPMFTLKQARFNVSLLENIPEKFSAFHWHGDTFNLPEDTKRLFLSEACENQGFIYSDRVIGLRFHLEMSNETIGNVIENCNDELIDGKYI